MKIKQILALTIALIGIVTLVSVPSANALHNCTSTTVLEPGQSCCGGVITSLLKCGGSAGATTTEDTGIWALLMMVINILTAGVGIAAVGGIIFGSIRYTTSAGSPDEMKKAKGIIVNVIIGLIAYALMYAFLNFIIPGGLFAG